MSWLALTLLLCGAANAPTDPLAPYLGRPLVAIEFEGAASEDTGELRSLLDIQPGFLLTAADLQASLKRLYALGRFSDVRVYAKRFSGSVSLTFYLKPTRRLGDLEIAGVVHGNIDELRQAIELRTGDEIDSRTPRRIEERALAYLQRTGFPQARAAVRRTSPVAVTPVDLELAIEEGDPLRVASLSFPGAPRVSPKLLESLASTRVGAILRRDRLAADGALLRKSYQQRGFLRVTVGEPRVEVVDGGAVVHFPIDAGPRIAIDFSGNTIFSNDHLRSLLELRDEPLRDRDIKALADRVGWEYRRLGRFRTRIEVKGFSDARAGVERYLLIIHEAQPLRVADIEFEGSRAFAPELLAEQVRSLLRRNLGRHGLAAPLGHSQACLAWRNGTPSEAMPYAKPCPPPEMHAEQRWVPEIYAQALDEIAAVYKNLGYLAVQVGPAEPRFDGDEVRVRVPVREGEQTFIRSMSFRGNEAFAAGELLDVALAATENRAVAAPLQPGSPISGTAIEDARIAMVRRYRENGYLYARVFTKATLSRDRRWVDLEYGVEEGPQVHIERVLVRGNHFTREGVIRSRITLKPGDVYRLDQALADQRAIAALGVFSSVRVKLIDEERPDERKDLVAEVVERDRQPIEIAPGISTADGPRLQASYSHINVFGTASTFTASLKLNRQVFFGLYGLYEDTLRDRYDELGVLEQIEREFRLGLRSPRIATLPMEPSLRFDLVHERTNALAYSLDSATLVFGLDMFPSQRLTFSLEPQLSLSNLECPTGDDGATFDCLGEFRALRPDRPRLDKGQRATFKIGPSLTYDRRDNPFNPSRGFYANTRAYYAVGSLQAGPLDEPEPIAFTSVEAMLTGYVALGGAVLALSARGGVLHSIAEIIPIDERFFLGGRDTLRGYVERTLIPEDACVVYTDLAEVRPRCDNVVERTSADPPVSPGGNTFVLLKSELRLPLTERVSLGLFVDAGNLWFSQPRPDDLALRFGTGAGLRYSTPVGALAVDFGFNPYRRVRNAETAGQVHFSVGVF